MRILETIAVVLIILWGLGLFFHIFGGLIHALLVSAIILFAVRLVRGK